jgi:uncharacterized protein (TIGR02118 family)
MFKAMILLKRRDDMTGEAFRSWLIDVHAPLAAQLPGLRRLVYDLVDEGRDTAGVDGIAELWFDTREAFDAAYTTDIGRAVAADSLAHVQSRTRVLVTERPIAEPDAR